VRAFEKQIRVIEKELVSACNRLQKKLQVTCLLLREIRALEIHEILHGGELFIGGKIRKNVNISVHIQRKLAYAASLTRIPFCVGKAEIGEMKKRKTA